MNNTTPTTPGAESPTTLKQDIWLSAGYLAIVIIIITVILANVFHKKLRATWSQYRCKDRNCKVELGREREMENGFILADGGLARAGEAWWKLELQRGLDDRERQDRDGVEMCVWERTSGSVV
ncbi:hypothetical protein IFR05_008748 [Cadophora sp. M221]|nr:hypothetical protein IFR05_008748 [Cadophora sp. M221]